jgi:hypothetical protein
MSNIYLWAWLFRCPTNIFGHGYLDVQQIYLGMKSVVFWVITQRRVVINYHKTPYNYPEDHRFNQHRGGSLKSRYLGMVI